MTYERPAAGYTSTSTSTNATKYQSDAAAIPKRAISSEKVDGDFNYLIDVVNDIASAGMSSSLPGQLGNANKVIITDGTTATWQLLDSDNMATNGVSAGSYPLANVTVDSKGLVTSVTAGTVGTAQIVDSAVSPAKLSSAFAGFVAPYAGATAPTGWLLCYGQAISRTTYAALFDAIGTIHGSGDGSTTFNVPDLRGRSVFGRDDMGGSTASRVTSGNSGITGTTLGAVGGDERLHQHNHNLTDPGHTHTVPKSSDAVGNSGGGSNPLGSPNTQISSSSTTGITINNAGSGSSQNMPPAVILNWLIKT